MGWILILRVALTLKLRVPASFLRSSRTDILASILTHSWVTWGLVSERLGILLASISVLLIVMSLALLLARARFLGAFVLVWKLWVME